VKLYVDASVLLRVVLGEPGILREWRRATRWISSALIRLECLRTLDRARVRFELADESLAARRNDVLAYLEAFELVDLDPNVLARAADPFPTALGTLDAVHLSTALLVRARVPDLVMATHDRELAIAARSLGLRTAGVAPLA
jgi:predicted nucleic acid-binding protein